MRRLLTQLLFMAMLAGAARAQQAIAPAHRYGRAVCIVPITGSGRTIGDPIRPLLVPGGLAKTRLPESIPADQLVGYTWQPSDDGKLAIVEYVVRSAGTLNQILADKRATCFVRGKDDKNVVEREIKKAKANFDLNTFGASVR